MSNLSSFRFSVLLFSQSLWRDITFLVVGCSERHCCTMIFFLWIFWRNSVLITSWVSLIPLSGTKMKRNMCKNEIWRMNSGLPHTHASFWLHTYMKLEIKLGKISGNAINFQFLFNFRYFFFLHELIYFRFSDIGVELMDAVILFVYCTKLQKLFSYVFFLAVVNRYMSLKSVFLKFYHYFKLKNYGFLILFWSTKIRGKFSDSFHLITFALSSGSFFLKECKVCIELFWDLWHLTHFWYSKNNKKVSFITFFLILWF